jgi:POT family proton-dependent oligopeptide transporter
MPLAWYFLLLGVFVLAVGTAVALGTPRLRRMLGAMR